MHTHFATTQRDSTGFLLLPGRPFCAVESESAPMETLLSPLSGQVWLRFRSAVIAICVLRGAQIQVVRVNEALLEQPALLDGKRTAIPHNTSWRARYQVAWDAMARGSRLDCLTTAEVKSTHDGASPCYVFGNHGLHDQAGLTSRDGSAKSPLA